MPTATTGAPRARARSIASSVESDTMNDSACIGWSSRSSAVTGWNVPRPTCSVIGATVTPRASSRASSASERWSPAVGAATAPGVRANTVW